MWQPSNAAAKKQVKKARKCQLPSPEPTYLVDRTVSSDEVYADLGLQLTIPGTTLSLWDSRDIFAGTRLPKEKIAVFIDAADNYDNMDIVGCCFLNSEGNDQRKMEKEFQDVYGPLGLKATFTVANAINISEEFCSQKIDPSPVPATDVPVVNVLARRTKEVTSQYDGTPFTTAPIDNLSPTDTVIPTIKTLGIVTTDDGFCAGFDIVYTTGERAQLYDTSYDGVKVGNRKSFQDFYYDNDDDINHIRYVYVSPDQLDRTALAVKLVLETDHYRGTPIETYTCGRFMSWEQSDLVCNGYSSLIGFEGEYESTEESERARLKKLTAITVPINGGVSESQRQDYHANFDYLRNLKYGYYQQPFTE